ncbi:hypothetical protein [Pantoea agglomerans]|uniref:hypothetical protein n=1 Tax=Enterobacter agglomerans TaxID=549 RepID=UPI00045C759F|nr:hypothetical protein [Pantoea agglomerans]KDA93464.1 hypothetical protein T296_17495 [Pantoea agglomerans Eh318]
MLPLTAALKPLPPALAWFSSELIISGDRLTGFGLTEAGQLEITAAPSMIRVKRR